MSETQRPPVSSALTRKLPLPPSKVMSSGAQMLAGGVLLALTAAALGALDVRQPFGTRWRNPDVLYV